jgi:cystathionine beta-lyase/cystathionine gamma-synthase
MCLTFWIEVHQIECTWRRQRLGRAVKALSGLEPLRGNQTLDVRFMKHQESLEKQEEKNLRRQFKFELPPLDCY